MVMEWKCFFGWGFQITLPGIRWSFSTATKHRRKLVELNGQQFHVAIGTGYRVYPCFFFEGTPWQDFFSIPQVANP
jgi:hypothetical protein